MFHIFYGQTNVDTHNSENFVFTSIPQDAVNEIQAHRRWVRLVGQFIYSLAQLRLGGRYGRVIARNLGLLYFSAHFTFHNYSLLCLSFPISLTYLNLAVSYSQVLWRRTLFHKLHIEGNLTECYFIFATLMVLAQFEASPVYDYDFLL